MIRYGIFVVLLLFVNISNSEGTECDIFKSAFKSYYECILSCYKDVFGITKIKGDICTKDLVLSAGEKDKFPISSIKDSIDCITARCRTAFPPSVCESSTNQGGSGNSQGIDIDDGGTISGSSDTGDVSASDEENEEFEYEDYDCYEVDIEEQSDDGKGDRGKSDIGKGDDEENNSEQSNDGKGDGTNSNIGKGDGANSNIGKGDGGSVSDTGSDATESSEEYYDASYYYSSEYYDDKDEDSSSKAPAETDKTQITNVNGGGGNIPKESEKNENSAAVVVSTTNNGNSGSSPWTSFFNFRKNQPAPALPSGSGTDNGEDSAQPGSQEPANNEPLQPTSDNQAPTTTNTNTRNGPGRWWSWFSNMAPAVPVAPADSGSANGFGNSDDAIGNVEPIANSYDSTGNAGQLVNSYDDTGNSGPLVNSYDTTGNTGQNENFYGSTGNDGSNGYNYFGNNFGNSYDAIGNAGSVNSGGDTAVSSAAASAAGIGGGNFAISNSFASTGNLAPAPIANGNMGSDYNGYNPPPLATGPNLGNDYGSNAAASAVATAGTGSSNNGALNNMLSMLSKNGAGNVGEGLGPITLNFGDDRIVINGKQVQWHRNDQLMNTFILN